MQFSWRLWEQVAYEELCLWWKQVKKEVWGKRRRKTRTSCRFAGGLLRTRQRMSATQQAQREWEGTRPQIHYLGTSHRINWSRKKAGCLEIRRWWRRTEKWESKQDSKNESPPLKLQNILTLPESARATGIWAISDSEDCLNILFIFYSLFLSGNSTQDLGNISLLWQSISSFFIHTSRLCGRWSKSNGRALEGWMLGKVACAGTCRKSRLWCGTCLCT